MANDCLVTKLKAVVSNPDLPILETMQQITLDTITRSGNIAISDEQKWALNHFFYQIGAVSNSGLWSKVAMIMLPILGVDKNTTNQEYKTTTGYLENHPLMIDEAGAIELGLNQEQAVVNANPLFKNFQAGNYNLKNFAFVILPPADESFSTDSTLQIYFGSPNVKAGIAISGSSEKQFACRIYDSTTEGSKRFDTSIQSSDAILCNFTTASIEGYSIYNDNITSVSQTEYGNYADVNGVLENIVPSIKLWSAQKYGVLIAFNSSLTDDEVQKVLNITTELRSIFFN